MRRHLRQNLHNHTVFSDGRFPPARLIEEAMAAGLTAFGLSDHAFTRKVFRAGSLASWSETVLPQYLRVAREIRTLGFDDLRVWCGLELDSCLERVGAELSGLPWEQLNQLDYLLLEYVGEADKGGLPFERLPEIRAWCRIPVILAHPDPDRWEETLPIDRAFAIVRECGAALELPGGTRNAWPWARRDAGLLTGLPLTIGCDTHECIADVGDIDRVLWFLEANSLLDQLTDPDRMAPRWGGNQ